MTDWPAANGAAAWILTPSNVKLAPFEFQLLKRSEQRIGPAPHIAGVKFLAAVAPDEPLRVAFDVSTPRTRFEVRAGERIVATGQFEPAAAAPPATQRAA